MLISFGNVHLLAVEGLEHDKEDTEMVQGAFSQPWAEEHGLELIGGIRMSPLLPRRR